MAPAPPPSINGPDISAPLADYFFIAGIESSQVYDGPAVAAAVLSAPSPQVKDIVDENRPVDTKTDGQQAGSSAVTSDDTLRRMRPASDGFKSFNCDSPVAGTTAAGSNRSSAATLKAPAGQFADLSNGAFEEALKKFASERDSFLDDISFRAGTVRNSNSISTPTHQRRPRPRTVRIAAEDDAPPTPGGAAGSLRAGVGSLRRRFSTMNSNMKRLSVMSRPVSVRTAKRLSGYASVIPSPQPFLATPDMHPLKRRYEPVLLDRYPGVAVGDETKRRHPFPDYVPMFAFPNDVTVVSSDERPRSTWHGFAMTGQDGGQLYGVCAIVWIPLNSEASAGLEQQCEEWRRANMSDEERELASSLGERLSMERAKLSRLLADLSALASGSEAREQLEEEIGSVEEKIALMADLLRPVRHGAASKIDGLTEGDSGFWIPRAYGILGRDLTLMSFWKEWLKAILVPMLNGAVLRAPPSSPRVGIWLPLERYVVNLCVEALCPITSITQVEVAVRDLRLYARKEALNELPGSRNVDLYPLFRCLSLQNIILLLEYTLAESRIVLLSSHTAMLQLACAAITTLLYPLRWTGVLIPVLPARLVQALEAPCPYIAGVERRYEKLELPEEDICLVDLDENVIEADAPPVSLPRPQRRKLQSLLAIAAPHHNRYGVPTGPPPYAVETFPADAFSSESPQIFTPIASRSTLATYVSESSTTFGSAPTAPHPVFNAFRASRTADVSRYNDRPSTSSTRTCHSQSSGHSPPSPVGVSPASSNFPSTVGSRNDSAFALQASLREKRSGHLTDALPRRNSAFGTLDRISSMRPGPMANHQTSMSTSMLEGSYAPSVYAQSTVAASTIMPQMMVQPVRDNETTKWVEGHCLLKQPRDNRRICAVCDERCDEDHFRCSGCAASVHYQCLSAVTLVCPVAFRPDQIRAAFVRCFASLFYTYRKYMHPATGERRKAGLIYHFHMDQFLRSVPHGDSEYMHMLRQTQAFNEFIHDRESTRAEDPSIKLFDDIILSKRNRGHRSLFSRTQTTFLGDTSDHLWRSAAATPPTSQQPCDSPPMPGRTPAKLDPSLMREPRSIQGAPRLQRARKRKPVASMLG
ncbi:DENN-domain-containing protein [Piedraia hortae CBS 480.64]|uniref:DENN-domain-containing protein n=1 Tax=Piedraia hortae CBS 480.64 TaxID=1314780 RepID=A0A6A7C999_9PEZI|nr:DENN-domain-containing protein [Piedraia hortae CBS 480.64]